jgi:sulfur relay (sulfurtransferase) DsrF/TusC family protein
MQKTNPGSIQARDYQKCLNYIEKYWKEITCYLPKDKFKQLGLPNKFVSPNHDVSATTNFTGTVTLSSSDW